MEISNWNTLLHISPLLFQAYVFIAINICKIEEKYNSLNTKREAFHST